MRFRSGVTSEQPALKQVEPTFTTKTLFVIDSGLLFPKPKQKELLEKVEVGDRTYIVAGHLDARSTDFDLTTQGAIPLARFYWRSEAAVGHPVVVFLQERISNHVDPPFSEVKEEGKKYVGLARIHKIVVLGDRPEDPKERTYKTVLEDHFYTARPVYAKLVERGLYELWFVYDRVERNSYIIKSEKQEGSIMSTQTYSLDTVKHAIDTVPKLQELGYTG